MLSGMQVQSQCSGGTLAGSITPTIPWKTIPCVKAGEYYEFAATAGNYYTFTFCMAGGDALWNTELTILDNAGGYAGGYNTGACGPGSDVRYWGPAPSTGTFRVLITEFAGTPCQTNNLCATMAYKCETTPFTGPGSTCATADPISSLPYISGGLSTCFKGYDYNSSQTCNSLYMDGEDYVFSYNGTAGECISIFTRNTFIYTGLFILDGCPDLASTNCIAATEAGAGQPILSNVTLPTTGTYYFVIATYPAPNCTPFDIEVVPCVAVGVGDTCGNAFVIPSLPYANSGFTTCGYGDDYNSSQQCGSQYMDGEDFVFSYTSPGNECVDIDFTGTSSWAGFHVLDGCPDNPGTTCIASRGEIGGNPRLRSVIFNLPGTYYIVVSTYSPPNCTPFNFSITPCGPSCSSNPNLSDNCTTATPVTLGINDSICGFSNYLFTPDSSPDLDADFCGSVENNGWFSFVADSAAMTFRIDVDNCLTGFGIQGGIFETSDCLNFTPVSNCWNPQIIANGSMQATGLVPGNTYYMMIDGYAGDDCEFTASRVGGPFPVVWGTYTAQLLDEDVVLDWNTFSEINSKGFHIQRGHAMKSSEYNAVKWETIGFVDGKGDSPDGHTYRYIDQNVEFTGEPWFYRLQQIDYDGVSSFSEVRQVDINGPQEPELISFYPNPASNFVTINYYMPGADRVHFRLYNLAGQVLQSDELDGKTEGVHYRDVSLETLPSGLYIYELSIGTKNIRGKLEIMH